MNGQTMHRFFVHPQAIHHSTAVLDEAIAHQLRHVLRMRPGARIIVLDNQGWEYEIELAEITSKGARGTVIEKRAASGEPSVYVTLYQCALKKDNFEWVLQKGTEIGVSRFVPVISRRTVIADGERIKSKLPRWERIITEAAEQSHRGRIPELDAPVAFEQALADTASADLALIPWENETARTLREVLPSKAAEVALIVGPEGGFEDGEIELARQHGVQPVTLGPRILRAETAAAAAALLVLYELERS
jgi:16S rRNA (uracil1498-N3)-methyltransferase